MIEHNTGDVVVQTARLTKIFRDFWMREKVTAVSELDLKVAPCEVFGLLGPNGSGKSTTLKMILGLLFPTRGQISVFGRHPTDVATKSRIGFLPEESYLYPFLDARETLDFYGRLFRQPRQERRRRTDMLLDMVGLSAVAYRRIGEYSKGMQRRIGLAQALINDPDLLILDEPTSGMDPIGTRQFKDLIRMLAHRGKTVIISSHLLADMEDICDRVCILYGGRKRASGNIEDLLSNSDQTQITTGRIDESAIKKINAVLIAAGVDVIDISTPRDKLESLFLRIVKEAQDQRLATGGSLGGGELADFLKGDGQAEGKQVIEQLVEAALPVEVQADHTPATEPEPAADAEVIDGLVSASQTRQDEQTQDSGKQLDKPHKKVDKGVIDDLLGDEDQADE